MGRARHGDRGLRRSQASLSGDQLVGQTLGRRWLHLGFVRSLQDTRARGLHTVGYSNQAATTRNACTAARAAPSASPGRRSQTRSAASAPAPPRPQPVVVEIKPAPPPPAPAPSPAPSPVVEVKPPPAPPIVPSPVPPAVTPPVTPAPERYTLSQLAALTCGKVSVRQEGKRNTLDGYVGSEGDLELVKAVAANVPDTSVGEMLLAPWPQCEAAPDTRAAACDVGSTGCRNRTREPISQRRSARRHDPLPGQISYLLRQLRAGGWVGRASRPTFGTGPAADPATPDAQLRRRPEWRGNFTIGPPFGREMIIAVASRSPLFDHALPAQQTEREYLTELRRALIYKPSPDLPDRELSASIATLQTEGK